MARESRFVINNDFVMGIDVGATTTIIADTISSGLHKVTTSDYPDLYAILDEYFEKSGALPTNVTIAMAGPRDDVTGGVKMTNSHLPLFVPGKAEEIYPGVKFSTINDAGAAAAGIILPSKVDLITLKPGTPTPTGTKFVLTISTGVGGCMAVWDESSQRHIFVPCEPGHIGFQPYNKKQIEYLDHLSKNHEYPSVELAICGMWGIKNIINHGLLGFNAKKLKSSIKKAITNRQPPGSVLLEYAKEGSGVDQEAAKHILDNMGTLVGGILSGYSLILKATGGIYLRGGVATGLGQYWAEHTGFLDAFKRKGTPEHAPWLEEFTSKIPIYLSMDPNNGVHGALELAKTEAKKEATRR